MPKIIDKTGQRFGHLIVLKRLKGNDINHPKWKCRCDCGKILITTNITRTSEGSKSCGCSRFKDYSGKRFGRLLILRRVPRDSRQAFYECRCDCGKVIVRTNITTAKSCGCQRIETVMAANSLRVTKDSAFKAVLCTYKGNARRRGISWELTDDEFRTLTSSSCFYTGRLPATVRKEHPHDGGIYTYNGIDRRDNSKGYTPENTVSCCSEINYFKSDMSQDRFIALCCEVAANADSQNLGSTLQCSKSGRIAEQIELTLKIFNPQVKGCWAKSPQPVLFFCQLCPPTLTT